MLDVCGCKIIFVVRHVNIILKNKDELNWGSKYKGFIVYKREKKVVRTTKYLAT